MEKKHDEIVGKKNQPSTNSYIAADIYPYFICIEC